LKLKFDKLLLSLAFNLEARPYIMVVVATLHWLILLAWVYGYRPWWATALRDPKQQQQQQQKQHPARHWLALCCALWHVAALAEVLDFPPLYGRAAGPG